jgi:hypothetical protein
MVCGMQGLNANRPIFPELSNEMAYQAGDPGTERDAGILAIRLSARACPGADQPWLQ